MFAKEVSRALSIARNNLATKSEPSSPIPTDNKKYYLIEKIMCSDNSQVSDAETRQKRKRMKSSSSALSLNDNLHTTLLFQLYYYV